MSYKYLLNNCVNLEIHPIHVCEINIPENKHFDYNYNKRKTDNMTRTYIGMDYKVKKGEKK